MGRASLSITVRVACVDHLSFTGQITVWVCSVGCQLIATAQVTSWAGGREVVVLLHVTVISCFITQTYTCLSKFHSPSHNGKIW